MSNDYGGPVPADCVGEVKRTSLLLCGSGRSAERTELLPRTWLTSTVKLQWTFEKVWPNESRRCEPNSRVGNRRAMSDRHRDTGWKDADGQPAGNCGCATEFPKGIRP